jgi:hypothetical protein
MKTVKYGIEITFPDYKILSVDAIQEILFHHPTLKDCLVNVYINFTPEFLRKNQLRRKK